MKTMMRTSNQKPEVETCSCDFGPGERELDRAQYATCRCWYSWYHRPGCHGCRVSAIQDAVVTHRQPSSTHAHKRPGQRGELPETAGKFQAAIIIAQGTR
jgi:hypothetical protein